LSSIPSFIFKILERKKKLFYKYPEALRIINNVIKLLFNFAIKIAMTRSVHRYGNSLVRADEIHFRCSPSCQKTSE